MREFLIGFLVGLLLTLAAGAVASVWAYRRFVVLERRTRRAERLAELGTLTAGLAHEIKNPLSTIQLNLQLLQEDLPTESVVGSRVHNRMRTVRQEASRLRDILDDFLRYAGRLTVEPEMIELNAMLEEVCDFFAPQASTNGVRLRFDASPVPVRAYADPKLIKQAVLNLMLNGTQAMTGRPGGELMVGAALEPDAAVIRITDTGPGIGPDAVKRIFDAYFTTKKGGTGLGLPMTKRIAEEHGGSLELSSEVGKGSRFTLRLPLEKGRKVRARTIVDTRSSRPDATKSL